MSVLLTTAAGRVSTARTIRWSPVLLAPLVTAAILVLAAAAGRSRHAGASFVGEAGLLITAASLAFVADDLSGETAPATPVGLRTRLLARLTLVAPATAVGWLCVLAMYQRVTAVDIGDLLPDRAIAALGLGLVSASTALLVHRRLRVPSPGATGAASTVAAATVVSVGAPTDWIAALPPAPVGWAIVATAAVAVIIGATREPSS